MTTKWPIVGHRHAVSLLQREVARGGLAHAYLFAGPPHIGKRSLSHVLAQALLCQEDDPPCGDCDSCRRVIRRQHPDLQILDLPAQTRILGEKSSTGQVLKIETIRKVQQGLFRRPLQADHKVIIIPEAHLMTTAAANAFLKMLEEPPPYALLLLTTTQVEDLLPTIVSRCQVIPLHLLKITDVETALQRPPWQLEPAPARLLAHLSGGRIGWAIRAHEDPAVLEDREETLETLQQALAGDDLERMEIAEQMARLPEQGMETLATWSTWWRDLLLFQSGASNGLTNVDRHDELAQVAQAWGVAETHAALSTLQETISALERNVNALLAWEAFLLSLPKSSGPRP